MLGRFRISLLVLLVGAGCSDRPNAVAPPLSNVVSHPLSDQTYHTLTWVKHPPQYVPWAGREYTWTMQATGCSAAEPACTFYFGDQFQCTSTALHGASCSLTVGWTGYGVVLHGYVSSANGSGFANASAVYGNYPCTAYISGPDHIYTSGTYQYTVNISGSTQDYCTGITYSWTGDATSSSSTVNVTYTVDAQDYNGSVNLDMTSKGYTLSLSKQPTIHAASPVYVSIGDASEIGAYVGCNWGASVSGGVAPYSYAWMINGSPYGNDSNILAYTNTGSGFTIGLVVTDSQGRTGSTSLGVSIVSGMACT
jgi:hypothetical protein